MPRASINTILSLNPGKRRWYLAIDCGSKLACRSRGPSAGIGGDRLAAVAVAAVAGSVFPGEVVIHPGVRYALGQRLLQRIQQAPCASAAPASPPASN
jgi:hypothetical protein